MYISERIVNESVCPECLEEGVIGGILGFLVAGPTLAQGAGVLAGAAGYSVGGTPGGIAGATIGATLGAIAGIRIGSRIEEYVKTKYAEGVSKCGNDKNCKINAYKKLISELRKNSTYCNKSKDPKECKERVMSSIKKYEEKITELLSSE